MTKEKQTGDVALWMVYILTALLFGAFLGSPVPDSWADRISRMLSSVSEPAVNPEDLHSKTPAYYTAITEDKTAADDKTIIASDPPAPVPDAEKQPDYLVSGANRGGAADRKEMDVLIHLINAEAYGLSYKAKVAVGQVVMNRWTGPYYGDDLMAIMTAPYQFTPIHNGSAYKKKIEPDSVKAANAVLSGAGVKELTDDTYYFVNPDFTEDKTIETKMQFVCVIEGIHFFRPPDKNTY